MDADRHRQHNVISQHELRVAQVLRDDPGRWFDSGAL